MKATKLFKTYRNVFDLPIDVFNKLGSGEDVPVPADVVKKYPQLFEEIKTVKKEIEVKK